MRIPWRNDPSINNESCMGKKGKTKPGKGYILSWGYAVSSSVGAHGGQRMCFETSVSSLTMALFIVNQAGGTSRGKNLCITSKLYKWTIGPFIAVQLTKKIPIRIIQALDYLSQFQQLSILIIFSVRSHLQHPVTFCITHKFQELSKWFMRAL